MSLTAKEFQKKIQSGEIVSTKKGLVTKALLQPELSEKTTGVLIGNKKIKNARKVDFNLEPILTSIPEWRKTHPGMIYFDSLIEGSFYQFLHENDISFEYKEKIVIIQKFEYLDEKESSLTWQPDFQITMNGKVRIIIDTKGYPNESFPIKLKIYKFYHYCKYSRNEEISMPYIWFVKNKKMFPIALNCINRVLNRQPLNGIDSVLLFNNQKSKHGKRKNDQN